MNDEQKIGIYCVGNKLMLDDGVGPYVYEQLQAYVFPSHVALFDLGCLTLDRINDVQNYDLLIVVDAVDGTEQPPGTIFRFKPHDMARHPFGTQSLHDLSLSDLFDAAELLGYSCEGICFGMQVQNPSPAYACMGLTEPVAAKLADLVDCVLAELVSRGIPIVEQSSGKAVECGYHHEIVGRLDIVSSY